MRLGPTRSAGFAAFASCVTPAAIGGWSWSIVARCSSACREILIERANAGEEAASRDGSGLAHLIRTDRRQLVVNKRARILGIGRILRKRRRVRPLDEAGQRLLRAREARRTHAPVRIPCMTTTYGSGSVGR